MSSDCKYSATLLIGPTASGKTPLGNLIAERGLPDGSYVHFDFGQQLREIQRERGARAVLSARDCQLVEEVLRSGRLLTPEETPLAMTVLRWFLDTLPNAHSVPMKIVLNGLPRTVHQARAMAGLIEVQRVVLLQSTQEVTWVRIQSNVGGDRGARVDDTRDLVAFKFRQYLAETQPLVEYFRSQRVPIVELRVLADSRPEELWQLLCDAIRSEKDMSNESLRTAM